VAAIDFLNPALSISDFLKAVSVTARIIGARSHGNPLGPFLAAQPFRIQTAGDWRVVAVKMPTDRSPAVARVSAPRPKPQSLTLDTLAPASAVQPSRTPLKKRIWTSGPYHADATFLSLEGNIVRLLRTSGVRTSIPIEKLSPADQLWIRNYLASQ
jgi:hypothetical protein